MCCNDRVAGGWPKLVARPDTAETARRYAAADPALTGRAGVDDITGAPAKGAGPDRADEVPGSVRPAARYGGDNADGDPLLHLLSDGVPALASRFPGPHHRVSVIAAEPLLASTGAPAGPGRHTAAWECGAQKRAIRPTRSSTLSVPRAA
jgi:hypothetical protein